MKTKGRLLIMRSPALVGSSVMLVFLGLAPVSMQAQSARKNPTSKVYISDVNGDAQIDTNDNIQDLAKHSVYNVEGAIIETKKADAGEDKSKIFSTIVYSNGTGAFFDENTHVEVNRFQQEPFTPNRTDMDVEPSISQTQAYVVHGTVGLCASKLVAGSTMNYGTALGSVNIRGQKVVIEATDNQTKISMLDGDSTVRGGTQDLGGQILHSGEQAIIRPGGVGRPNIVQVQRIPPAEMSTLSDKVSMACLAKKTVYFEAKERPSTTEAAPEAAATSAAKTEDKTSNGDASTASGASTDSSGSAAPVTAFNGPAVNSPAVIQGTNTVQEIVAVPVVPTNLPVQFTVSPARIVTPTPPGG